MLFLLVIIFPNVSHGVVFVCCSVPETEMFSLFPASKSGDKMGTIRSSHRCIKGMGHRPDSAADICDAIVEKCQLL